MCYKTVAFDLDDVICYRPDGYEHLGVDKYNYCMPYQEAVDLVNSSKKGSINIGCL